MRRVVPAAVAVTLTAGLVGALPAGASPSPAPNSLDPYGRGVSAPLEGRRSAAPTPAAVPAVPDPGTGALTAKSLRPAALPVLPPPAVTVPIATATVVPTVSAPLAAGQVYQLGIRTPVVPVSLRALSFRLPASVRASRTVAAEVVQEGATPRTLAVVGTSLTAAPSRTVVVGKRKRVDPAALQVVVQLKARYTLPPRTSLRVRLSTFTNPSYGVFPVLLVLHGDALAPVGWGISSWLIRYPKKCRTSRLVNEIAIENRSTGTRAWQDGVTDTGVIRGYADTRSGVCGDSVTLRVSTSARYFTVQAFRIGYYGGRGGRLIWTSGPVLGGKRPIPAALGRDHLVEAKWPVSITVPVSPSWTPGTYLFKFSNPDGTASYYPYVVREPLPAPVVRVPGAPSPPAPVLPDVVVVHGTNTKQVYNQWGPNPNDPTGNRGYSGYYGPSGTATDRANVTSFDRPYDLTGDGGLVDESYPMIRFLEEKGYNVSYVTDDQLDVLDPLLLKAKAVVFPDHTEYWSAAMRASVERLARAKINLAFFYGNTAYWRTRIQVTATGVKRVVMYKYDANGHLIDPLRANATLATARWRDKPIDNPEQRLLGSQYSCVHQMVPEAGWPLTRPADGGAAWLFADTGLAPGQSVAKIYHRETDQVFDEIPVPAGVTRRVLASTPIDATAAHVSCHTGGPGAAPGGTPKSPSPARADTVISALPSGAAVFSAGTFGWACQLYANCRWSKGDLAASQAVRAMTANILEPFRRGPAGALATAP